MNITENYNSAASRFGEQLAREMLSAGIPDKYLLSACRFHCLPPNKTIDFLKIQFRQWMTYVVPFNKQIDVNNLTYEQFDKIIRDEQQKHVCPNKFYDDGNITIGEFKNKKDAALCPLKPIYDSNYGFCVCSELGFNKYNKQGYRIIVIIDKSKILANDITKYVFALVKDGGIDMWNANNNPMKADTWKYINNLPKKAREALLSFVKSTNNQENQQNTNMKTENRKRNVVRLTESQLKQMIVESVKNVLNEISYKTYANAASAAEDRESIFKKSPTYPYPNIPEGPKSPEFYKNYKKDAELAYRQSKQPEKFKKAAYAALSHEICGEDDFWKYITSRINNNDVGEDLAEKIKQYQEGEKYIRNNGTKWSVRNQKD